MEHRGGRQIPCRATLLIIACRQHDLCQAFKRGWDWSAGAGLHTASLPASSPALQGKASEWQDHLTLHYISSKARPDSGEALEPADAARLFEEKLKAALLAEDGQLALSRLAGTTVSTLMPKIETQGQVSQARW